MCDQPVGDDRDDRDSCEREKPGAAARDAAGPAGGDAGAPKRQLEVASALVTVVGIFRQTTADDVVERAGLHRRRLALHDRGDQAGAARAFEGAAAGDHLVDDRAEGEDVGAGVGVARLELLGRHVRHRAEQRPLFRQRLLLRGVVGAERLRLVLRQAEVEHLRPRLREHDVARLEIAMDDAEAVRGVERAGDVDRHAERLAQRQRPARDRVGERLPFEVLHDQVVDAVLMADVVERADVRMVQPRDRARLAVEALAQLRARGEMRGQDLDGDVAVETRVAGAIDLAHAAGAERGDDFVGTEACEVLDTDDYRFPNRFATSMDAARHALSARAWHRQCGNEIDQEVPPCDPLHSRSCSFSSP